MVTKEFAEASAELIEILKYFPKADVEKIPLKLRNFFKEVANPQCSVKIDPYKSLQEQNINEKTRDLIAIIYRNYWCNEEEIRLLDKKFIENDKIYEQKLREKYNPDNIFNNQIKKSQELIEYKPQNLIQKILTKVKNLLKRNKNN